MKHIIKKSKLFLSFALAMLLIFGTLGVLWAINLNYNRPRPLMDYVPQEIGIYDTLYENLTESDCRSCHGSSLADRHHATPTVVNERKCIVCHEVNPDLPSGVAIIRDCTTGGCHSQWDLDSNGWHHNTDMSGSGNCVTCHDPSLIEPITPIRDFNMYPPSVVTPSPFSCENCHWEQVASITEDPQNPGHPSTYNHVNDKGEFIGFYEYGKPIVGNYQTHHMGFLGNVASECYRCHSLNPQSPSWNPFEQQLIRYCEICHSIGTLHRIGPHVKNTNGWEAVGFHVAGNSDPADLDPIRYRTWDSPSYAPQVQPGFSADEQCFGCHGDNVPLLPPPPPPQVPVIDNSADGIQPSHGCCGAIVTLRGAYFGEEKAQGYKVQLYTGTEWIDMPIHAWTDTLIEFEIPCWELLAPGNYNVRVVTPTGESNQRVFTLEASCDALCIKIDPKEGPCGTWIKVSLCDPDVGSFGTSRTKIFDDGYHGVYSLVDFSASQGTYTALNYRNWTEKSFEVRFYDFFKDRLNPERNFVQDSGSEPTLAKGTGLALGKWSLSMKFIYFGDKNGNGTFDSGDTIMQVVSSDPLYFDLINTPNIYRITPTRIDHNNLVTIYGINFGYPQGSGEVRIGSLGEATHPDLGKGTVLSNVKSWSNTMIKVRLTGLPPEWTGQYKYLWVEKGKTNGSWSEIVGKAKSNYQKIKILVPLP